VRSLDECLPSGLAVKVASIPPPDDPDSYLRQHGADAFREILSRAQGFFDYYLAQLISENDLTTDRGRLNVVRSMAEKVNRTANAVLIDTYAQRTATRLGVTADAMRQEFRKVVPQAPRPTPPPRASVPPPPPSREESSAGGVEGEMNAAPIADEDNPFASEGPGHVARVSPTVSRPGPAEFWLLKFLLLADQDLLSWAAAYLDCQWITHQTLRHIVGLRLGQAGNENLGELAPLLDQLADDPFAAQLVTEAAMEQRAIPELNTQLIEATLRLRNQWVDRQLLLLTGRLSDPEVSDDERLGIMQQQQQLRFWKKTPLAELGGS
jgi:DNA primase